MVQKFVVRLLDDADTLLAWAEVYASPRPQGERRSCPFWAPGQTSFPIERDGIASKITVHWCDLDIARVGPPLEHVTVSAGQVFAFTWMQPIWLVAGMQDVPLPAVTLRQSATLSPPTGALAAV